MFPTEPSCLVPVIELSGHRPGPAPPILNPGQSCRTCVVQESWVPYSHDGWSEAEIPLLLEVMKGTHGFAIGEQDTGPHQGIIFSLGNGYTAGVVPVQVLSLGSELKPVSLRDLSSVQRLSPAFANLWISKNMQDAKDNDLRVYYTAGRHSEVTLDCINQLLFFDLFPSPDQKDPITVRISPELIRYGVCQGAKVFPIIELYKDIAHPNAYAGLPEPGPLSDWHLLNQFGIKIEWETQDHEWMACYLHATEDLFGLSISEHLTGRVEKYVSTIYKKISYILGTIHNIEYKPMLDFKTRDRSVLIKHVYYSHLQQELTIRDYAVNYYAPPTLRSYHDNEMTLRRWFPDLVMGKTLDELLKILFPNEGKGPLMCDSCHTIQTTDRFVSKLYENGYIVCLLDQVLRRPCFYSPDHDLRRDEKRKLFLRQEYTSPFNISTATHILSPVRVRMQNFPLRQQGQTPVVGDCSTKRNA